MSNRWTNDIRVMRPSTGGISQPRVIVIEGLEAAGKDGATIDDLAALIGQDMRGSSPKSSIGRTLHGMLADGYVVCINDRWYLKETISYSNGSAPPAAPRPASKPAPVSVFSQKRSGKTVSIYTAPHILADVIGLAMLIGEQWYKIPLFGSVRICIGSEAPQWSPEQEMYSNVSVIKFTLKGGAVEEEHPAPKDIITIAPEE